jgi:outer membrane biosynthesis protein TonB
MPVSRTRQRQRRPANPALAELYSVWDEWAMAPDLGISGYKEPAGLFELSEEEGDTGKGVGEAATEFLDGPAAAPPAAPTAAPVAAATPQPDAPKHKGKPPKAPAAPKTSSPRPQTRQERHERLNRKRGEAAADAKEQALVVKAAVDKAAGASTKADETKARVAAERAAIAAAAAAAAASAQATTEQNAALKTQKAAEAAQAQKAAQKAAQDAAKLMTPKKKAGFLERVRDAAMEGWTALLAENDESE